MPIPKSLRFLRQDNKHLLCGLSEHLGLSYSAVVQYAINRLALREGILKPSEPEEKPTSSYRTLKF